MRAAHARRFSSPEFARRARQLRDYGQTAKYRHEFIGYNSRLDELQAALLGRVMLPRLDGWIARRRDIAMEYANGLANKAVVPLIPAAHRSDRSELSWHLYPVAVAPERKSAFLEYLKANGIAPGEHYPIAIPDQPAMASAGREDHGCAVARMLCASEVSLPIHPYLTEEEVQHVVNTCNRWRG